MPCPLKVTNHPSNRPPVLNHPKVPNHLRATFLPRVPSLRRATFLPNSLPPVLNRLRVASLRKTRQPWENLLAASPQAPARLSAPAHFIAACHLARALLAPAIPCPA